MSVPAGWYDDGSGRQRWWDGGRWTDDFAPALGAVGQSSPSGRVSPAGRVASAGPVSSAGSLSLSKGPGAPVLGFVGLGLAVLGTVLACIPAVFGIGVVVLVAAFVVSFIGLFRKGAAKWPSIVGMILSVVGGVVGAVVVVVPLLASVQGPAVPPTDVPTSASPEEPSELPSAGTSEGRPSPEEIAEGFKALAQAEGLTTYDDMPDFYPCFGQHLYDSDVSDESLRLVVAGQDPLASERESAGQAIIDATLACDPQP